MLTFALYSLLALYNPYVCIEFCFIKFILNYKLQGDGRQVKKQLVIILQNQWLGKSTVVCLVFLII